MFLPNSLSPTLSEILIVNIVCFKHPTYHCIFLVPPQSALHLGGVLNLCGITQFPRRCESSHKSFRNFNFWLRMESRRLSDLSILFFQAPEKDLCPLNFSHSSRIRDYNFSFNNRVGLQSDVNELNHFKTLFY